MSAQTPTVVTVGPTYVNMVLKSQQALIHGKTISGSGFTCEPTGPGPNRAIEAAKCHCDVYLVTKIGDDAFGRMIVAKLEEYNVKNDLVFIAQAISTGINFTLVDNNGENTGCICEGANRALGSDDIHYASTEHIISQSDVCLIYDQLNKDVVIEAIKLAKLHNKKVILETQMEIIEGNPVSQLGWPKEYYLADVLLPNFNTGTDIQELGSSGVHKLKMMASEFVAAGIECVIIKLGPRGTFIVDRKESLQIPGFHVDRLDRTGCASAFAGALAACAGCGDSPQDAVRFAAAAGALACTKFGSLDSLPSKEDIITLLQEQPD